VRIDTDCVQFVSGVVILNAVKDLACELEIALFPAHPGAPGFACGSEPVLSVGEGMTTAQELFRIPITRC
jgi:hypothetical protein